MASRWRAPTRSGQQPESPKAKTRGVVGRAVERAVVRRESKGWASERRLGGNWTAIFALAMVLTVVLAMGLAAVVRASRIEEVKVGRS